MNETPRAIYEKALTFRNDIKLAITNVEIAETDVKLSKANLQPSISAFYGYSTRLSYADRLAGQENFQRFRWHHQNAGEVVNTRVEQREVIGPQAVADQLGQNDGHNFGIALNIPIFNGFWRKTTSRKAS